MTHYLATYESRNFAFDGFGQTEAEATEALVTALRAHATEYQLQPDWFAVDGWTETDLFQIRALELGIGYRDREALAGVAVTAPIPPAPVERPRVAVVIKDGMVDEIFATDAVDALVIDQDIVDADRDQLFWYYVHFGEEKRLATIASHDVAVDPYLVNGFGETLREIQKAQLRQECFIGAA